MLSPFFVQNPRYYPSWVCTHGLKILEKRAAMWKGLHFLSYEKHSEQACSMTNLEGTIKQIMNFLVKLVTKF